MKLLHTGANCQTLKVWCWNWTFWNCGDFKSPPPQTVVTNRYFYRRPPLIRRSFTSRLPPRSITCRYAPQCTRITSPSSMWANERPFGRKDQTKTAAAAAFFSDSGDLYGGRSQHLDTPTDSPWHALFITSLKTYPESTDNKPPNFQFKTFIAN